LVRRTVPKTIKKTDSVDSGEGDNKEGGGGVETQYKWAFKLGVIHTFVTGSWSRLQNRTGFDIDVSAC